MLQICCKNTWAISRISVSLQKIATTQKRNKSRTNVLVLNAGSSTVKFGLFSISDQPAGTEWLPRDATFVASGNRLQTKSAFLLIRFQFSNALATGVEQAPWTKSAHPEINPTDFLSHCTTSRPSRRARTTLSPSKPDPSTSRPLSRFAAASATPLPFRLSLSHPIRPPSLLARPACPRRADAPDAASPSRRSRFATTARRSTRSCGASPTPPAKGCALRRLPRPAAAPVALSSFALSARLPSLFPFSFPGRARGHRRLVYRAHKSRA